MSKHSRPGVVPEVPEKQAASAVVDSDARASQPRRCRYCPDFYCGDHRGMLPGRWSRSKSSHVRSRTTCRSGLRRERGSVPRWPTGSPRESVRRKQVEVRSRRGHSSCGKYCPCPCPPQTTAALPSRGAQRRVARSQDGEDDLNDWW